MASPIPKILLLLGATAVVGIGVWIASADRSNERVPQNLTCIDTAVVTGQEGAAPDMTSAVPTGTSRAEARLEPSSSRATLEADATSAEEEPAEDWNSLSGREIPDPTYRVTVRGRVVDQEDVPIPHAVLRAFDTYSFLGPAKTTVPVKSDGTFEIRDLEVTGFVRWTVKARGHTAIELGADYPESEGELFDKGDVVLHSGEARVRGTVLGLDGRPMLHARVAAHYPAGGCSGTILALATSATTDAAGDFYLDGLKPKTQFVKAWVGEFPTQVARITPVKFDASGMCQVVIRLRKSRVLRGVTHGPGGTPAAGVRVMMRTPLTLTWRVSGAEGRYELDDSNLEEDNWIHAIDFSRNAFTAVSVTTDSLNPAEAHLYLRECQGTMTVRVVDDLTSAPVRHSQFAMVHPHYFFNHANAIPIDTPAEIAPGLYQFPYSPTGGDLAWIDVSAPGYLIRRSAPFIGDGHVNLSTIDIRLVKPSDAFNRK